MKKSILFVLFIYPFLNVNGQFYLGGSIGYTIEIPGILSRFNPAHGLSTSAEIRKLNGKFGFSIDFNQMRSIWNLYGSNNNYKAIKTITIPCKINFDYYFLSEKKLSPFIGVGVGLAQTKSLESYSVNGEVNRNEVTGSSTCYNIRSGLLIDTKLGKLNFSLNYLYLPNQRFDPRKSKYNKEYAHIFNFGMGMLFEI